MASRLSNIVVASLIHDTHQITKAFEDNIVERGPLPQKKPQPIFTNRGCQFIIATTIVVQSKK